MILTQLFVEIDDFMKEYEVEMKRHLLTDGTIRRDRKSQLALSEIMTIVVFFQISGYRNFKHYYLNYVSRHLKTAFPNLLSYQRFVALKPRILLPLTMFMQIRRRGRCSGISL